MKRIDPKEITAETTVATLLERWPHLRRAFQARRMFCPGCAMSRFDLLGYVADVYGLPADRWLRELRREAALHPSGRRLVRTVTRPKRRHSHATY
jgi:hypothetical protein